MLKTVVMFSNILLRKNYGNLKNHKGGFNYPTEITKYLEKEAFNKAIVCHLKNYPFSSGIKLSRLDSVPKKISLDRRVIF